MDINHAQTPEPQQAEGSMDYQGFIKTLKYLLDAAWGSKWGSFTPDNPNVKDPTDVSYPIILHELTSLEPGKIGERREMKPRLRGNRYFQNDGPNGTQPPSVKVLGQRLDAVVTFEVWDETNDAALRLAANFRQFLNMYAGYLQEQGLIGIQFEKMYKSTDTIRDVGKAYKVVYHIQIEELTVLPVDVFRILEVVDEQLHIQTGE